MTFENNNTNQQPNSKPAETPESVPGFGENGLAAGQPQSDQADLLARFARPEAAPPELPRPVSGQEQQEPALPQEPVAREPHPGQHFFQTPVQYEQSLPAPVAQAAANPHRQSFPDWLFKLVFVRCLIAVVLALTLELVVNYYTRSPQMHAIVAQATEEILKFDYARAYETVKPAARQGYPPALRLVAHILYFTPSEVDNSVQAYKLLAEAARRGDAISQIQLVGFRLQDAADPTWRFQRQARLGDPTAMLELYDIFIAGRGGVRKRPGFAKKMLVEAAENHNVRAEYIAGLMYLRGNGLKLDREKGARLIMAAANAGFKYAYPEAARLFASGKGVALNRQAALKWIIVTKNTPGVALDQELELYLTSIATKLTQKEREQAYVEASEFVQQHPLGPMEKADTVKM
ncbi:MAG: hypothetical protein PHW69_02715 [Elusimicrobiaceae bacterium]|nr:hypothetical protein [Elusimicrobiaceae bacterium]